jgi:hypothetical protein
MKKTCPSFVYWFRKDNPRLASLTTAAGCQEGDSFPEMQWDLAGDWNRTKDTLSNDNKTWEFAGHREFTADLNIYDAAYFKYIRIIAQDQDENTTDELIKITFK